MPLRAAVAALLRSLLVFALLAVGTTTHAQEIPEAPARLDRGRFTIIHYPHDARLAASLADLAVRSDSFPGFPRPRERVLIAIAPDRERFREWIGPQVPEWGAAVAFPSLQRIIMQGSRAGTDAGDPREVLRHEIAHLVVHEFLGDLPPRWFDEGYASWAAREWRREDALETNLSIAVGGMPTLQELEAMFQGGAGSADAAYAFAHRAVAELATIGGPNGLALLTSNWERTGSFERAVRATYGLTVAGFEKEWRDRTRRRYGALSLVANLAILGTIVSFILIPLYMARRRRDRAKLEAMVVADARAEQQAREAAERSILETLLNPAPPDGPSGGGDRSA